MIGNRKEKLKQLLQKSLDKADERDITWLKKWHKVRKRSAFFGFNEKRLKKTLSDLWGLTIGRQIRKNK